MSQNHQRTPLSNNGASEFNPPTQQNNYYNVYNAPASGYQNTGFPMNSMPMMSMMGDMPMNNMMYNNYSQQQDKPYASHYNDIMYLKPEQLAKVFDQKISDSHGCKNLQAKIENLKPDSKIFKVVYEKLLENLKVYSEDQFANYVCQKVVEICSKEQMSTMIDVLIDDVVDMSFTPHGTRVIQKIIENVEDEKASDSLLVAYEGHVVDLVLDTNGNHVVQKILTYFEPEKVDYMYKEIMKRGEEVASHKHGCCVLQRCIDFCNEDQIDSVIGGILSHCESLINDQYGNYVIQYILELKNYEDHKEIIAKTINKGIHHYCYQKYSSNVVEQSLKVDLKSVFKAFIKLVSKKEELLKMGHHKFGNYVLQTALMRHRKSKLVIPVLNTIKSIMQEFTENEIGAKVVSKLSKVFDFWLEDDVTLKVNDKDYSKKRKYTKKKKNFKNTGIDQNMMMYPMGFDNNLNNPGYVNMNMNLNVNFNLNYAQNQAKHQQNQF